MKPRPWTKNDVRRLRILAKARHSSHFAATALRRTPGAVRYKAMVLRIRFVSMGRAFSAKQRRRWK